MPVYLRRILFWGFVLLFFILGPSLVLYTAGYRLNWENGRVIRTGVISISTTPRNANILLDGELTRQETPHVFKQLLPDDYTVTLQKDGHLSWEGVAEVQSSQTVSLQNILLFLDTPTEELFQKDLQTLSVHPSGGLIAYLVQQAGWSELWLYDITSENHQLISQTATAEDARNLELRWSANGNYLSLFEPGQQPVLFAASGDRISIDLPDEPPLNVRWHPSTDHLLYFSTDAGLLQYDMVVKTFALLADTNESSVQLDANVLTFFDNGSQTEVQQIENDDKRVLALLPRDGYELLLRDGSLLLLQNDEEEIILLNIDSSEPILLQRDATSFDWSEESKLLVFSDGSEVNVYNANTHETTFITRQSLPIESVLWHSVGQHIIVQDTADFQAYEWLPLAEDRYVTTLIDDVNVMNWWMDESGETVYLYGEKDGAYSFFKRDLTNTILNFEL